METFPQYFRKDGTLIRRDGPTSGIIIKLPAPKKNVPNAIDTLNHDTYPSRERLDAALIEYQVSDEETFNQFLDTYFKNANYMSSLFYKKVKPQDVSAQSKSTTS